VFYGLLLWNVPSKKKFIWMATIVCITSLTSSLKGARILFLLPVVFSFWYYYRFYVTPKWTNQIRKALIPFLLLFIILFAIKLTRNDKSIVKNVANLNPFLIFKPILLETGSTLQTVASYIEFKQEIPGDYPFVLEPILYPYYYFAYHKIMTSGQSVALVKVRNSLNHRLTYYTAPNEYLHGAGLGSSMVAEDYQYGLIYLIIIAIIFGRFLVFLEKNFVKGSLFLFLSPIIVPTIIFAPRASPFPNTWGIIKFLLILVIIKLLLYFFRVVSKKPDNKEQLTLNFDQ